MAEVRVKPQSDKNVEDTVIFFDLKSVYFCEFLHYFLYARNDVDKSTVFNRALPSLSLEIMLYQSL